MADFVGEFETLDQPVPDLDIGDIPLVARPALIQPGDGIVQWGQVKSSRAMALSSGVRSS